MCDNETSSHSSQSRLSTNDEFSSWEKSVEDEGELEGEHQHEDENVRTRNPDW